MRVLPVAAVLALAACNPTFNWREVRPESTGLKAMLPCKPDKGSRTVPMAARPVELHVLGCDTADANFALVFGDVKDPLRSGDMLAQWKVATLGNMRATRAEEGPFLPPGAMALRQSVRVNASGQRVDGSKVESQSAFFARGSQVFHAVIYADRVSPEVAQTFFSGLAFE